MRVIVATSYSDRTETAVYKALAAEGIDVHMNCRPNAPEEPELTAAGVRVSEWTVRHRLDLAASRALRRLIRKEDPDIVYAPTNRGLAAALRAGRGSRARIVAYRGTIGHLKKYDPAAWITYFHPRIARIVCVSRAVEQHLLSMGLPNSRLVTIHKGHDPDWYAGPPSRTRADFGIPDEAFVVGFAGAMRPVKGVDVLLEAALGRELANRTDIHFLLVGEVRDGRIHSLARKGANRDRVHLPGRIDRAATLAKLFDVCVMPSLAREGLPRAVMEAMAQQVPVIVSDVGGMPEVVEHNRGGLIVPPGNAAALADAVAGLAGDRQRCIELGRRAKERIVKDFHVGRTIAQTLQLYRELAV